MKRKVLFTISLVLAFLMLVSAAGLALTSVPVKKISLNESSLTVSVGQTVELIATISPTDATSKTLKWYTSNKKNVTVDKNGMIKALKIGRAYIMVK